MQNLPTITCVNERAKSNHLPKAVLDELYNPMRPTRSAVLYVSLRDEDGECPGYTWTWAAGGLMGREMAVQAHTGAWEFYRQVCVGLWEHRKTVLVDGRTLCEGFTLEVEEEGF